MTSIHQSLVAAAWLGVFFAALFVVTLAVLEITAVVAKPRWGKPTDTRPGGTPTPI